jgi:hypothetical protein
MPAYLSKFEKIDIMSVTEIRQQLHKVIDEMADKELLQAMLTLLAQDRSQPEKYHLTDEQLNILREREEKYQKGESQIQSLEAGCRRGDTEVRAITVA